MKFFEYIEITYDKLTNQLEYWLKETYNKSNKLFSHASPHGIILHIQKILFSNNILYLKNSLNQIDIRTSTNKNFIINQSIISGHNPSRAISASGTINIKLKNGVKYSNEIKGGKLIFQHDTLLRNKTNQLYYTISTGKFIKNIFNINTHTNIVFSIKQGKYEEQSYTGTGDKNMSISVIIDRTKNIDNFDFSIYYNGQSLKIVDSLYDMLPNEMSCYTKTGFNGGLDIFFGTGSYGFIPEIGSIITVKYLITDGYKGNILNNIINDFTFIDNVYDSDGQSVNMDKLFDILIQDDINFGVDGESVNHIKSILPNVSRNFVLASPEQFIYHLKRLNIFSKVNAFNLLDENNFNNNKYIDKFINDTFGNTLNSEIIKDKMIKYFPTIYSNQIYLYLIPKIKNYLINDYNYFNIPFDVFYLDDNEKKKVLDYLKTLGTLSLTTNVIIIQPIISLYIINIYIRRYRTDIQDNIKNQIIDIISDYFINNERFDRIIKSDIIKEIKNNILSIDSVNIEFVSKKNEDYHRNGKLTNIDNNINIIKNRKKYKKLPYDENTVLGIDPVQGDIIVNNDELPVLRGGWYDRNGVYYNDDPSTNGLSSINIIWSGINENKLIK